MTREIFLADADARSLIGLGEGVAGHLMGLGKGGARSLMWFFVL